MAQCLCLKLKRYSQNQKQISVIHAKYIHSVLRRMLSHGPTCGVYQDDTDGSFKIGWSKFKYNDEHVFVDGEKYNAT